MRNKNISNLKDLYEAKIHTMIYFFVEKVNCNHISKRKYKKLRLITSLYKNIMHSYSLTKIISSADNLNQLVI